MPVSMLLAADVHEDLKLLLMAVLIAVEHEVIKKHSTDHLQMG